MKLLTNIELKDKLTERCEKAVKVENLNWYLEAEPTTAQVVGEEDFIVLFDHENEFTLNVSDVLGSGYFDGEVEEGLHGWVYETSEIIEAAYKWLSYKVGKMTYMEAREWLFNMAASYEPLNYTMA